MSAATIGEMGNLAERIRQGDASAETELVREFTQRIFVMGVVRTHDRETARELVQDVLMAVISALRKGQLQDADKLAAFVVSWVLIFSLGMVMRLAEILRSSFFRRAGKFAFISSSEQELFPDASALLTRGLERILLAF